MTLTGLRVSPIVTLPLIKCTWVEFLDSSFETPPYLDRGYRYNVGSDKRSSLKVFHGKRTIFYVLGRHSKPVKPVQVRFSLQQAIIRDYLKSKHFKENKIFIMEAFKEK